jgi:hypothetical protein
MTTWTRSECIGLAKSDCVHCRGYGTRLIWRGAREVACNCVYRKAFRACLMRFRECQAEGHKCNTVSWDLFGGKAGSRHFGRKREEYSADFCLVARRCLDDLDYAVFTWHFVMGADWRLCCRRLRIDRGTVFHAIYRIEQTLGRAFGEIKPYGLWPLSEYFSGYRTAA